MQMVFGRSKFEYHATTTTNDAEREAGIGYPKMVTGHTTAGELQRRVGKLAPGNSQFSNGSRNCIAVDAINPT